MPRAKILVWTCVFVCVAAFTSEDALVNVPPIDDNVEQFVEVPLSVSEQEALLGLEQLPSVPGSLPCDSSTQKCSQDNDEVREDDGAREARRLTALPNVDNVHFQDIDLIRGQIAGIVSWTFTTPNPPLGVTGYEVFLTDSIGSVSGRVALGAVGAVCAPFATCSHTLTFPSESLGSFTHIFVHTRTALGVSPLGAGTVVCDVDHTDSIHLVNTYPTNAPWGIIEASFYRTSDCTGAPMLFAVASSSGDAPTYTPSKAVDGSAATAWVSNCSAPCGIGSQSFGILGICEPQQLGCFKLKQCYLKTGDVCFSAGGGRATGLALMVAGSLVQTWTALMPEFANNLLITEETLVLASRRRRGYYNVFSDLEPDIARTTNPGFTR